MGKNTPKLDMNGKKEYIDLHLFYELKWLLDAATEWSIQDQLRLGIAGYNVQVYAMDSTFVHARTLFEFFLKPTGDNYYGCNEFTGGVLESQIYKDDWQGPLHSFVMHAQDRSRPRPLKSSGVDKELNQMPVDFAREILRLWQEFEKKLCETGDRELQELAREKREEATRKSKFVVESTVAKQHAQAKGETLSPLFVLP